MSRLGQHGILDGSGVDFETLNDRGLMRLWLVEACKAAGATILQIGSHRFEPQGITVFCLLAESHASIHTYPEHGRYMADVFTCGDIDPRVALVHLHQKFGGPGHIEIFDRPLTAQPK